MKLNLNPNCDRNPPKSEKNMILRHFSPFPVKINSKCTEIWPKLWNMCPTLGKYFWQNSKSLRNKFEKIERKSILKPNSEKISYFSMKSWPNSNQNWWKFRENQWNSCTTPWLKFIENQLFLIINSLKINENLAQNWEKIS